MRKPEAPFPISATSHTLHISPSNSSAYDDLQKGHVICGFPLYNGT